MKKWTGNGATSFCFDGGHSEDTLGGTGGALTGVQCNGGYLGYFSSMRYPVALGVSQSFS